MQLQQKLGLIFDKRANALPTLNLPYATYQATNYDPNGGVCSRSSQCQMVLTCEQDLYL
jgi:hypothetical protein